MSEILPSVEGRMEMTHQDFQRACQIAIRDFQQEPICQSYLVALFCEAVRCSRECCEIAGGSESKRKLDRLRAENARLVHQVECQARSITMLEDAVGKDLCVVEAVNEIKRIRAENVRLVDELEKARSDINVLKNVAKHDADSLANWARRHAEMRDDLIKTAQSRDRFKEEAEKSHSRSSR